MLPIVRVKSVEEGIERSLQAEHNYKHTAIIHSHDVENITAYCARSAPELRHTFFAHEMWALYEKGELRPDTRLTGEFTFDPTAANVDEVLMQIEEARREAEIRQAGREAAEAAED